MNKLGDLVVCFFAFIMIVSPPKENSGQTIETKYSTPTTAMERVDLLLNSRIEDLNQTNQNIIQHTHSWERLNKLFDEKQSSNCNYKYFKVIRSKDRDGEKKLKYVPITSREYKQLFAILSQNEN